MLAAAAASLRQATRQGAVPGPSCWRGPAAAAPPVLVPSLGTRPFHSSIAASTWGGKKPKTHSGTAKRFRPSSKKRMAVDHRAHPSRRLPIMMQAMALRQEQQQQQTAAAAAAAAADTAPAPAPAGQASIDDVGMAASAGILRPNTLVPQQPADRKAIRALVSGRLPMRVLGHVWRSGHPGKRHLNSKMPSGRGQRLRRAKMWGSGPVNKMLHRLAGSHY